MSAEDYKKYIDDTLSNILLRLDRVFDKMGNYQAKPKKKPTRAQTKQPIAEQVLNQQSMEDHRYTIPLADLVMMQMVGNFDAFLELLTPNGNGEHGERFAEALRMIEDTRKQTTAQKLFPSIVEKTIEAQFGEKHVALRELGQNAIDAYTPEEQERPVLFHVEKENGHLVLRVRDYGIGMDVKGVIRDLLIPYNSGKEFDPTKIGEHGIGWYSVVDLASLVKTTTRQRDGNGAVQTLVYRDRETWKATIVPSTPDGFYGPLHKKPHGTEVTVYIPEQTTSPEDIRDFLFQYLGMVDSRNGQIFLGAAMINSAREAYRQASPIPVSIEREKKPLTMGVSKRGLSGDLNDPRFRHRNKNLEKILYTQRGLFVKYDTHPFHEETIHAQLIADLQKMGLDFWVEVPEHATLTKGRNSVIGDHRNPVLEGMYRAFEDLFLNVLLSDEQVVYHSSGTLLSSIANLFDKYYAQTAKVLEERKYSRKRRWLSKAAAAGMSAIDLGALAGRLAGKGAYYAGLGIVRGVRATPKGLRKAALYPFAHLPSDLEKLAAYLTEKAPEWGEQAAGAIRFYGPFGVAVGGGLYGGIELYKHFGWKPYLYLGYGIGGSLGLAVAGAVVYGGYRLACALPEIIQDLREVTLSDVGRAIGKSMLSVGKGMRKIYRTIDDFVADASENVERFIRDTSLAVLKKCGLYINVEAKRERKREKKRRKIARKYLSQLQKDEFFARIMNKQIIAAEVYRAVGKEEDASSGREQHYHGFYWKRKGGEREKHDVKLSIDEIIDLYLRGRLHDMNAVGEQYRQNYESGSHFVDFKNPLVNVVVEKLEKSIHDIRRKYDVRVLEDRLDSLWSFTKGTATVAKEIALLGYYLSGIGILHSLASELFGTVSNPFERAWFYQGMRRSVSSLDARMRKAFSKENLLSKVYGVRDDVETVVNGTVALGILGARAGLWLGVHSPRLLYRLAHGTYTSLLVPSARAFHPARYLGYAASLAQWGRRVAQQRKERIREREERRAERKRLFGEESRLKMLCKEAGNWIAEWYYGSVWYELFGYGVKPGALDNIDIGKVQRMVEIAGTGHAYVDFMKAVSAMDALVAEALGQKPYRAVLAYDRSLETLEQGGFQPDRRGTLHIDLRDASELVARVPRIREEQENKSGYSAGFGYLLLDYLLHVRTHDALKKYKHDVGPYNHVAHPPNFYAQKAAFRRRVVDHLLERGIQVEQYLDQFLPPFSEHEDVLYYLDPKIFSNLFQMTRRRLYDERLKYQMERQSVIMHRERQKREAELANAMSAQQPVPGAE